MRSVVLKGLLSKHSYLHSPSLLYGPVLLHWAWTRNRPLEPLKSAGSADPRDSHPFQVLRRHSRHLQTRSLCELLGFQDQIVCSTGTCHLQISKIPRIDGQTSAFRAKVNGAQSKLRDHGVLLRAAGREDESRPQAKAQRCVLPPEPRQQGPRSARASGQTAGLSVLVCRRKGQRAVSSRLHSHTLMTGNFTHTHVHPGHTSLHSPGGQGLLGKPCGWGPARRKPVASCHSLY